VASGSDNICVSWFISNMGSDVISLLDSWFISNMGSAVISLLGSWFISGMGSDVISCFVSDIGSDNICFASVFGFGIKESDYPFCFFGF
jgi:hypothetical protein